MDLVIAFVAVVFVLVAALSWLTENERLKQQARNQRWRQHTKKSQPQRLKKASRR